jgi:hypothetical protein
MQESERLCICVLGKSVYDFPIGFWNCSNSDMICFLIKSPKQSLGDLLFLLRFLLLSLPNDVGRLIVFAPFLIIKSPKQRWETYCFCSVTYYYYYYSYSPFFPWTMNLSTADLRNYWTEFHETWWSYWYMFLVDPKGLRFVVKGVEAIFLGVQRGWGLL